VSRLLWVLRHAKAVADPPAGQADHDRPLAPRGRRDAAALGARLAGDGLGFDRSDLPDLVLCSTALRTRQTVELVLGSSAPPEVDFRRALFYASPEEALAEVRTVPDDRRSVLLVGHNPTAHALAAELGDDPEGRADIEARGFPTCSLAVYRLPSAPWIDTALGTGQLAGLFTPPY
jgi:phosphohistidine phosphatase